MRFLVLGSSGMAGHVIARYLQERGHDVTGFSRRPSLFSPCFVGDACDEELVRDILRRGQFDIVVNAIGILNADAERNEELATYVNGEFPHLLVEATEGTSTRVIHMSTDCVFAGNSGPYNESSVPDGPTIYDRTKAAGEINDKKNLTLRNSIVGPDINPDGIGLFNWFMGQKGPVKGYERAMWTGMTTVELARAIEHAALEGDAGLVNMVPGENISKYDLLCLFNDAFRANDVEIVPDDSVVLDKTLVRTNFSSSFRPKPYPEQIDDMAAWVKAHAGMYPHYELKELLSE